MNIPEMTLPEPTWPRNIGTASWTESEVRAILAARDAQYAAMAGQEPVAMHDSDCSTNNRGVPELLGPCDCSHQTRSAFEDFANRRYAPKGYQPERDGDGYKADAWQLAWEAWLEASREMDDMRRAYELLFKENARLRAAQPEPTNSAAQERAEPVTGKFTLGDTVQKTKGSQWRGTVVGTYSTRLTPEGYAVESSTEKGSVQIYPASALTDEQIILKCATAGIDWTPPSHGYVGVFSSVSMVPMRRLLEGLPSPQTEELCRPLLDDDGWVVTLAEGYSGWGYYAHCEECPEEGAVFVCSATPPAPAQPIDMLLYCPNCGVQHVDMTEHVLIDRGPNSPPSNQKTWDNPPHRSHLCHSCKCVWRPADVPTNGVEAIKTEGKADTWPVPHNEEVIAAIAQPSPEPSKPEQAEAPKNPHHDYLRRYWQDGFDGKPLGACTGDAPMRAHREGFEAACSLVATLPPASAAGEQPDLLEKIDALENHIHQTTVWSRSDLQERATNERHVNAAFQLIDDLRAALATKPQAEQDKEDAARFAWYVGGQKTDSTAVLHLQMRAINGNWPTLDEWREAIDAARASNSGGAA